MEFLVQFDIDIPNRAGAPEVEERVQAEAAASAGLAEDGILVRLWRLPSPTGVTQLIGLYRAETDLELDRRLHGLPFKPWMRTSVTQLESHPNDPEVTRASVR